MNTTVTEYRGVSIERPENDATDDILDEVFVQDVYRVDAIPSGAVVVDLGANVGAFTLRAALERDARVVAYEPDPRTFPCLVRNVERVGCAGRVRCVAAAVAGARGRRTLYLDTGRPAGSTFYARWEEGTVAAVEVDAVTLLDVISDVGASGLVVKMDVEGAELEIFGDVGFAPALSFVDRLMVEWHSKQLVARRLQLHALGFATEHEGTILHAVR